MQFMAGTNCLDISANLAADSNVVQLVNPAAFGTVGDRLDIVHKPSWLARVRVTAHGTRLVVCIDAGKLLAFMRKKNITGVLPFARVRAFLLGCGPDMIQDMCKEFSVYSATVGPRSCFYQPHGVVVIERTGTTGDNFGVMFSPIVQLTAKELEDFTTMAAEIQIQDSMHLDIIAELKKALAPPGDDKQKDDEAEDGNGLDNHVPKVATEATE